MNTRGKYSPIFLMTAIIMVAMLGPASSISFLLAQSSLHSGHIANNTTSKYIGQEGRIIKSLSPADIKSLQTGTGDAFGGMAKLAELNGYPGPRHVLDLTNELKLSDDQRKNITTIYDDMKEKAIELGQKIVNIERIANEEFANKSITDTQMKQLTLKSSEIYGHLRYTHLNTHLRMLDILTPEQITLYNNLRGYSHEQ
jgi:Spy/CpxP family protein refolding chaperone